MALVIGAAASAGGLESETHSDAAGRLQVDVHFDCALAPPLAALAAVGLLPTSSLKTGGLCVVEGWVVPAALPQVRGVAGVTRISAPSYVVRAPPRALQPILRKAVRPGQKLSGSGGIDQTAISIMRADQFVAQTGVTGTGVTIGVQSSGVYSLSLIQARGELPSSVRVLYPAGNSTPVTDDEGTALLEEVHAVAPGAQLVYCGPWTFVDYVSCLSQLIDAGATILLDDTGFVSDGLISQDNDQTSAISQVLAQNPAVMMLSAAGNNEGSYWEGNFSPISLASTSLPPLSCPIGVGTPDTYVAAFGSDNSQTLQVSGANYFPMLLAWADPPTQLTSHFDVFVYPTTDPTQMTCFSSAGTFSNQVIQSVPLQTGAYTVVIASPDTASSGKLLKLWAGGDGLTAFSVTAPGGLVSPQAMATGVINVGAVNASDGIGNTIEAFSSTGPLTVAFPTPSQLQAPNLVAPDGIVVDAAGTYFASSLFPDGNFYGTSAAVPNAAAIAALLRSAFPALSVAQLTDTLQQGATVLGAAAPDGVFGYGRVDAMGALGTLPAPTMTSLEDQSSSGSTATASQPFTVSGSGALHFSVSSSNTALVPNVIASPGSAGVALSSGCGTTTLSCTLSVTPALGQAGTATLTVSALDGANRMASSQMVLTATDPAPAPPPSTGTGTSTGTATTSTRSGGGGGALQLYALVWLATLAIFSRARMLRQAGTRSTSTL